MGMGKIEIFILEMAFLGMPFFVSASVMINEIAWMGSKVDSVASSQWQYYEWIELYNNGNDNVDLTGWMLSIVGKKDITFETAVNKIIPANGFYFIERLNYHAFDSITTDLAISFSAGLSNSGALLILKDTIGSPIDTVDGSDVWKIGGGDTIGNNTTKETAQRTNSGWITATATPKAVNAESSESLPQTPSEQSQSSPSQSSVGSGDSYIPPELLPKIKAFAGEDRTVTVGASAEFRGQAFGLEDEPLDNARYLWTFGDGGSKEGKNITHIYQYPGDYIVALNVSSGEYAASDYLSVKAVPNQVFISEIKTGADSFIELENKSKEEIDISGCRIKYDIQIFVFPQSTRIRPNAFLVIPFSVSEINLLQGKGFVEFLYSGGFKADTFNYNGILQGEQSFNRTNESSIISTETPAAKNSIVVAGSKTVSSPENRNVVANAEKSSEQENAGQAANIIAIGEKNKDNIAVYLIAISGLILFSGAAIFFIRRRSKSANIDKN